MRIKIESISSPFLLSLLTPKTWILIISFSSLSFLFLVKKYLLLKHKHGFVWKIKFLLFFLKKWIILHNLFRKNTTKQKIIKHESFWYFLHRSFLKISENILILMSICFISFVITQYLQRRKNKSIESKLIEICGICIKKQK